MKNPILVVSLALLLCFAFACQNQQGALSDEYNYVTAKQPIILFSINDGEVPSLLPHPSPEDIVQDSITVIRLSKDMPPVIRTVYGTTSSTILGSPRTAIVGRYGIVTNHDDRSGLKVPPEVTGQNQIVAVDLESDDLRVVSRVELAQQPLLALAHPDGKRVIVALSDHWGVYKVRDDGILVEVSQSKSPGTVYSFDISSDGRTIIATMAKGVNPVSSKAGIFHFVINEDSRIDLVGEIPSDKFKIDGPFSPRISPDGKRALCLNSDGWSDGVLDDVLVLDLTGDVEISQSIRQVADGLESLAFHPSGEFAVITCLDMHGGTATSHLAIVDLKGDEAQLLYHIPIELVPEGIEFTPDGTQLFVGSTRANHIVVYDVRGMNLYRSPYVLPTGFGHAALAVSAN
jgi:DNA-binding beta-propeller fold protein YncE